MDEGKSVAVASVILNGGSSPSYQWQDSTGAHSWLTVSGGNKATINYFPSSSGSKLRCLLTSDAACATVNMVISNTLTFTVNKNPVQDNGQIRFYPNPATSIFTIDSLSLSDNWEQVEIRNTAGALYFVRNIAGQAKVTIPVASLPDGIYMVVLRRQQAKPVYFKMFKL